jgi:hypothetical protein
MLSRLSKTLLIVSLVVLGSFLLAKIKAPHSSDSKQLTALLPLEKNIADSVGVYFWGGSLNNPEGGIINAGEKLAKDIGSQNLRIAMSAKSDSDYKGGGCISNFSLKDLAQRQDFQKILSDPSFKTIVITAYDGTSFSDCSTKNYLNPNFYSSANTQKIQQEYTDFAKYLATFSGKTFIISNWEGDNDVYCGAAFGASASGCPNSQQNLEGFKKWINARTAGIKSSGAGNVFSAVEFNIVRDLKDRGLPSVLYDVVPNVNADYFSYSSYESINALYSGDDGSQLKTDITAIKNVLSTSGKNSGNLIIGEFGFDQGSREEIKNKLQTVAGIAAGSGVKYSFIWNLLDTGGSFGLYDSSANLVAAGQYFCQLWGGSACGAAPALPPPVSAAVAASASVSAPTSGAKGGLVPCGRLQDDPSTKDVNETKPCTTCDIFALASRVMNFILFTLVPAVAVLFYLLGGLMILLSRGSPGLVTTGKNFFWNTTWGLVIIFGAWMITNTVLKSIVGDKDVSKNWFRIECTGVVQQPPTITKYACGSENKCVVNPNGKYINDPNCGDECAAAMAGTCKGKDCTGDTANICGPVNPGDNCNISAMSALSTDITAGAGNKTICSGVDTVKLLKAIIANESDGKVDLVSSDGLSAGPFQLTVETASNYKSACGVSETIDFNWLKRTDTVSKQACIAAEFIKTLVGICGCDVRQLAAGYNGGGKGKGACDVSTNCGSAAAAEGGQCSMCPNQTRSMKRWECLWDSNDHTACNIDRENGSFAPTRKYAPRVEYCYGQF